MVSRAFATAMVAAATAHAQGPVVTVRTTPDTVRLGEALTVIVRVVAPAGSRVALPPTPTGDGALEPLDPRVVDEVPTDSVVERIARYRLAAWQLGDRTLSFAAVVVERAGRTDSIAVRMPPVAVSTTLPADSARRVPRPERGVLKPPPSWWKWLNFLAAAAAVAAFAWWRGRRRGARGDDAPVDAWTAMRARWTALDGLRLVEAGEPGRAVIAEVDTLRTYLAVRFPAAHAGLTRREAASVLAREALPVLPERIAALFETADAVAFAGAPVPAATAREAARQARRVATEVQEAHDARIRAAERGPQPWRRR